MLDLVAVIEEEEEEEEEIRNSSSQFIVVYALFIRLPHGYYYEICPEKTHSHTIKDAHNLRAFSADPVLPVLWKQFPL